MTYLDTTLSLESVDLEGQLVELEALADKTVVVGVLGVCVGRWDGPVSVEVGAASRDGNCWQAVGVDRLRQRNGGHCKRQKSVGEHCAVRATR